jgi:hypothetical protein
VVRDAVLEVVVVDGGDLVVQQAGEQRGGDLRAVAVVGVRGLLDLEAGERGVQVLAAPRPDQQEAWLVAVATAEMKPLLVKIHMRAPLACRFCTGDYTTGLPEGRF